MRQRLHGPAAAYMLLVASTVAAEAKVISYEIDGRRYTYSNNNTRQTEIARRRIEAANAADAARVKAEAEAASNLLVRAFGSAAQREAEAARARLAAVMAETAAKAARTSTRRQTAAQRAPAGEVAEQAAGAEAGSSPERTGSLAAAPEPAPRERRPARTESARTEPAKTELAKTEAAKLVPAEPARRGAPGEAPAAPSAQTSPNAPAPTVTSIAVDTEAGIKTTFMSDGTVHEEPVDTNASPRS